MMKKANFEIMKTKMDRHFTEWSKRGLSLLGKIQIVKTFGLSQYLYTLAVTEISVEQWKVKLHDLMIASRIRRYMILLDKQVHPISDLQKN